MVNQCNIYHCNHLIETRIYKSEVNLNKGNKDIQKKYVAEFYIFFNLCNNNEQAYMNVLFWKFIWSKNSRSIVAMLPVTYYI